MTAVTHVSLYLLLLLLHRWLLIVLLFYFLELSYFCCVVIGQFGHCNQDLINLLLTGRATSNVMDGQVCLCYENLQCTLNYCTFVDVLGASCARGRKLHFTLLMPFLTCSRHCIPVYIGGVGGQWADHQGGVSTGCRGLPLPPRGPAVLRGMYHPILVFCALPCW